VNFLELNAGAKGKLLRVTTFSIILSLEVDSDAGIQGEMRINFREKLCVLSVSRRWLRSKKIPVIKQLEERISPESAKGFFPNVCESRPLFAIR